MPMKINLFWICFLFFGIQTSFGQLHIEPFDLSARIENAELTSLNVTNNHSSVFPYITSTDNKIADSSHFLVLSKSSKRMETKFYPLMNVSAGVETEGNFLYTAGLGVGLDLSSKKLSLSGKFLPYTTHSAYIADSIQTNLFQDLGASREIFKNGYFQNELLFLYRPNKFFTFLTGNGRNFFGEGYRSLILSDNAGSTPFFKIETTFSSIKYVNLYQLWTDNTVAPSNRNLDRKKFAAMHYISWNITREFNLSIFETVLWQSSDTLIDRNFDPNYLNPIVFYRPVEYGNGSADNVLLGANMSFKFDKNQSIYGQFILDDFLLSEIRARSRWWANKYGFQFGYKSQNFAGIENFYFQTEFNLVRPFTYSHKESVQSYGHLNSPVAHPIGANFIEVLNISSYQLGEFRIINKLTYSSYGADSAGISFGQNVFSSYSDRPDDYNQLIMQGKKKNVLNESFTIDRALSKKINLYLFANYNWRMEINELGIENRHYLILGIRSQIWNTYTDF